MDKEERELLRLTNILCNKVFSLCRKMDCPDGESLSRKVSEKIRELIGMMEGCEHNHLG